MKQYLYYFFSRYILLYFFLSIPAIGFMYVPELYPPIMILFLWIYTFMLKRKNNLQKDYFLFQAFLVLLISIALCISFILSQGYLSSPYWNIFYIITLPFSPLILSSTTFGNYSVVFISPIIIILAHFIFIYAMTKPQIQTRRITIWSLVMIITTTTSLYIYQNSPSQKFKGGHDFDYMNGYSSTDLSQFYPYTENSQLVELQEPSTFTIKNEKDMPILDGAEACYPVYSAIAKAVYKDIDQIEKAYSETENYNYYNTNGKIVTFTNTSVGYTRLINGEVDMFFGAKPSKSQLDEAREAGVEFEYTPIGQEAFVFFVNEDNPVSHLSTQQIKDIYHGDITNWQEVGGQNKDILAFQRPERSGSQSMMTHFMGDVSLKEPLQYEYVSAMTGIITDTAQYNGEKDAIGYTFRYFLEGLHQEEDVKILSVDGVEPTTENIKNKTYPISTYLYCVTLKSNQKENVKKLIDYLLSSQGQYIIEKTGYCALN